MSSSWTERGGVVVGVDGSAKGDAATRYAAVEAYRLGVRLDLVHVLPASIPVAPEHAPLVSDASLQSYGEEILERARKMALETRPAAEIETHLRSGSRVQELLACGEHARLIVIGNRSQRTVDRVWTGRTVTAVASSAACPVIVVPSEWEESLHRRIVVGVRTPGDAADLWEVAFPWAAERGAEIVAVHAWWLGGTYDAMIAHHGVCERWRLERVEVIEDELADYRAEFPDVPVHAFVRHEEPARALARASCGADLLVIQRPVPGRVVHLGRITRAVLHGARCPIVVLPEHRGAQARERHNEAEALVT